eukprot:NODE_251_length_1806_cov_19.664086_g224_i0.p1 GENE.NODE_251_length_1806_cov_19.664086_g224_i0~~NODE_251_length_1806_cov_19.664086_g224_i0.p1  ORF type:complete len:522 (+),score=93.84 NODE_251_length_1806_cov_19.664086_g224_i0:184-1749(+)
MLRALDDAMGAGTSPDKQNLQQAVAKLQHVVEDINERRKLVENSDKIMQVEAKLISNDQITLLTPTRRFIEEFDVWKIFKIGHVKERRLFLFNDCLVLASPTNKKKEKYVVKLAADLDAVHLQAPLIDDMDNTETREKRENLDKGVRMFNAGSRDAAISFLISSNVLSDGSPESVASFLLQHSDLRKVSIGEYLGTPSPFNQSVLESYLGQIEMEDLRPDEALRMFLAHFRLPGEAQIIDRIVEKFSSAYMAANPDTVLRDDLLHTFVFAVLMLNTSLHNPNVDRRMTLEDFIQNFRYADETELVSRSFLEHAYKSIKEEKLEMALDSDEMEGKIGVRVEGMPRTLCTGEVSRSVVVSIPERDQQLRLKISIGQGVTCNPSSVSFTTNSTQAFSLTVSANAQPGFRSLTLTRVGKTSKSYQKIPSFPILIQTPIEKYSFTMTVFPDNMSLLNYFQKRPPGSPAVQGGRGSRRDSLKEKPVKMKLGVPSNRDLRQAVTEIKAAMQALAHTKRSRRPLEDSRI